MIDVLKKEIKKLLEYYKENGKEKTLIKFKITEYILNDYLKVFELDFDNIINKFDHQDLLFLIELKEILPVKDYADFISRVGSIVAADISVQEYLNCKTENTFLKQKNIKLKKEIELLYKDKYTIQNLLYDIREEIRTDKKHYFNFNVNIQSNLKNNLNMLMLLSDIHFSEVVNLEQTNGLAEYNEAIAKERVLRFFEGALKTAKYTGVNNGYLLALGDWLSGNIHDELRRSNSNTASKATLLLADFIAELVRDYSSYFDNFEMYCVVGNHSRQDQKPTYKNAVQDNYEYLIYKIIEDKLKGKVKVIVSESLDCLVPVGDLFVKIEHGHNFKGGNNFLGIPAQTVSRDSLKDRAMYAAQDEKYDILAIGHFHKAGYLYDLFDKPMIFNPSVIGLSEVSKNKFHAGFPASQTVLVTDEKEIKYYRLINLLK